MQLVVPKWKNKLLFKISFYQILSPITTPTAPRLQPTLSLTQQFSLFHTTSPCLSKWKTKFTSDVKDQAPSKTYIRFATHQKRSDSKGALKNLISNINSDKNCFENKSRFNADEANDSDIGRGKAQSKRQIRSHYKKMKRKMKKKNIDDGFGDDSSRTFQAVFGNKWYTWSIGKQTDESQFQESTTGFEWRENSYRTYGRNDKWANESDAESDNESYVVGSSSDRTLLGLPVSGPLKIEDVKNAFRLSALKWHPDKHQGTEQALAEEKFKSCVAAYNSLRSTLSSV